ncbi:hypothetical protein [Methylobacterium fujisawaense]|uniref:hypothetical protein n=1 Tax=Methylobacterium fujisawaense TaxID=107400 RepID=UPI002F354D1B
MTNVQILPLRKLNPDHSERLASQLMQAQENHVDLGSRVQHIRAAGETIQQLSDRLRIHLDVTSHQLADLGVAERCQAEFAILRKLVELTATLAGTARLFSLPEQREI